MEIYPELMTKLLLLSFLLGMAEGAFYDILRLILKIPDTVGKKRLFFDIKLFLCDILFFLTSAVFISVLSFYFNNGKIRGFSYFGFFGGSFLYYVGIRKPFKLTIYWLYIKIIQVLKIITYPVKFILGILYKIVKKLSLKLIFALEIIYKKCYNKREVKNVFLRSKNSFINLK